MARELTLWCKGTFASPKDVVRIRSMELFSESLTLDLRGGLGPAELTLEDLAWVVV